MEQVIRYLCIPFNGKKNRVVPIYSVLKDPKLTKLKFLSVAIVPPEKNVFYKINFQIILKTANISTEHIEAMLFGPTKKDVIIPSQTFDLKKHQLEIEIIPDEMDEPDQNYAFDIEIEFSLST